MFRFWAVGCACIFFPLVSVDCAGEPCSLALHDNTVSIGNGNCTCAPGYYKANTALSLTETREWWCEPCEAGYFKAANGLSACLPCASDYTWSAVGQAACVQCSETSMLTPETRHRKCIPCPSTLVALLAYIDLQHIQNVAVSAATGQSLALNRANIAEFAQLFYIDEAQCRMPPMIANVASLLRARTICAAGTHVVVSPTTGQDGDTVCQDCEVGKFNGDMGALACKTVAACADARFLDLSLLKYSETARKINSNCALDWNAQAVSMGKNPYVMSGQTFLFDDTRHGIIVGYSQCVVGNTAKCIVFGVNRCVHDYVEAWKLGSIMLNSQNPSTCQYRCADGYYILNTKCTACVAGSYKPAAAPEAQLCQACAAGTHTSVSGAVACMSCAVGKYSSQDRTMCVDECRPGVFYHTGHLCYPVVRSYILELSEDLRTRRINVQVCPLASGPKDSPLSQWGASVQQIQYGGVGEAYCRVSSRCQTNQIWDRSSGSCKACAAVSNAQINQFEHGCMPSCNPGFFVVPIRVASGVTRAFTCERCENSFAAFQRENCAETSYLNDTCTEPNQNTPCLPCSGVQQAFQVFDALQVPPFAHSRVDRCQFRCRDVQFVGAKPWYYLDIATAAAMMGMDALQLQQKLAVHVAGAEKVCLFLCFWVFFRVLVCFTVFSCVYTFSAFLAQIVYF